MKLNEKIIKLRKEKGLSQEELGNAINVSRQAISKWESEQTKPDIDKLKELAKFFNVSFDYLLNDEIDDMEDILKETNIKEKTNIKKIIFKILLVILIIYLLISVYKFIVLFRYYKIADSFSEENYWMSYTWEEDGNPVLYTYTKKVGPQIVIETSNPYAGEDTLLDEEGNVISHDIEFIDQEREICYKLIYDKETNMYYYSDRRKNATNEEEFRNILGIDENLIKEKTLGLIPSDFKSILLASLNPMYQVSLARNEIYLNAFDRLKTRVLLTNDCLVESYIMETEFDGSIGLNYSYDYVQDHFDDVNIEEPLEKYKNQIINIEESY